MSFVEAFYSFNLDITNADVGLSTKIRIKTPRHPYEPLEHLYARMLAYIHSWQEGLVFSQGFYDLDQPAIWQKDILGNTLKWIEVGSPSKKKMTSALRTAPRPPAEANFAVYFYKQEQILSFCNELRGSKSNWISNVKFYRIDPQILAQIIPLEKTSASWSATIVDNTFYLYCDETELQTEIEPLDMWHQFQESISNVAQ